MLNKTVKVFLLWIMLLGGTILFLHLELETFDFYLGHHDAHDYGLIIKNTDTRTKTLKDILPNLVISKILCQNCINEVEIQVVQSCFNKSIKHFIAKQSTRTYLVNKTFLI